MRENGRFFLLSSAEHVADRQWLFGVNIRAIPPAAAKGLEQRDGVGIAGGPRLHDADQRLLIGLLRIEQGEIIDIAELQALSRDVEALECRLLRSDRLLQRDCIGLNAAQRVRDILKGCHNRAAILGGGLLVGGLRGEFAVQQDAAVEDGLRDAA